VRASARLGLSLVVLGSALFTVRAGADERPVGVAGSARLAGETLMEHVVAQVGGSVITWSELAAEARLKLLRAHGPSTALLHELDPELLASVLRGMIHRELLLGEVRRLQLQAVSDVDVAREVDKLAARAGGQRELARFLAVIGVEVGAGGVSESLAPLVRAELEAQRLLEARVRTAASAAEGELLACFQLHREELFRGRRFVEVREQIRGALLEQRREAAVRALIEDAAARASIRFADFDTLPLFAEPPAGRLLCLPEPGARAPLEGRR
jgi:hypothetical protein